MKITTPSELGRFPLTRSLLGACASLLVACSGGADDESRADDDNLHLDAGERDDVHRDAGERDDQRGDAAGDEVTTDNRDEARDEDAGTPRDEDDPEAAGTDDAPGDDGDQPTDDGTDASETAESGDGLVVDDLSDEELERLFQEDAEADGEVTVRVVEIENPDERDALDDLAGRLADGAKLQRVELIEPQQRRLHVDQLELFGSAEEAESLAAFHDIQTSVIISPAFQLLEPARPRAFLDGEAPDLSVGVVPQPEPEPEPEPGPTLVLVPITEDSGNVTLAAPSEPVQPAGLGLTTGDAESVVRYVANDALPLFSEPHFDAAVELELERGDRVFVFDTLPVHVDGAWFVEIQLADRNGQPVGWVPLPWLYDKTVTTQSGTLDFNATYGLFSKQIAGFIEDNFYAACSNYPVYPHNGLVVQPQYDPNLLPDDKNYRCGEFPVGDTYSSSHKHITTLDFTTPGFEHDGKLFKIDIDPIPLSIPIDMLRLSGQTRGSNYDMRDLSTAWSPQGSADIDEFRLYSRFPNHEQQTVFETDDAVRVHDSDFWFNVSYEPPAGVTAEADAYINSCFYLPGSTLSSRRFDTDIKLTTKSVKTRTSHITGIEFGSVEFSRFRVCTTATVTQRSNATPNSDGIIDHLAPNATPGPLVVRFVRGTIQDIEIAYHGQPKLYGSFDPLHDAVLSTLMNVLGDLLEEGLPFSIQGKDLSGGAGPLIWQGWLKGALEKELLQQLDVIAARFTGSLPDPTRALQRACDLIMPAAYADISSPFYPLYQQCLEATREVDIDAIVPPALDSSCYEPGTFARASDGKNWRSDENTDDLYYFSDAPGDLLTIDRPFWVNGCRVRSEAETRAMSEWWPLLQCMADVIDRDVNYGLSSASISSNLQSQCLKPAVGMLCELYGEGDDLIALWTGQDPAFSAPSTFGFCAYYEELDKEPCTPSTCLTIE